MCKLNAFPCCTANHATDVAPHVLSFDSRWEWSVSHPGRFTHTRRTNGSHWIGGFVCARLIKIPAAVGI